MYRVDLGYDGSHHLDHCAVIGIWAKCILCKGCDL